MPEQQSAAAAAWVGRVLAGHRIEAFVGEGGMGMVYRATHLRLHRTVALKLLPPALSADQDFRRRFEREAAIAASLEHPNVVPIYDAGHADGVLYLSMRFVDGEDLGAVLRREGRLDVGRLCSILGPVADALDTVHEAGLVHRDVKPGNILLARAARPRGAQVYLCDFGIAKGPSGSDITSAGQYIGTLQYSSPEQIEGGWLTGRSDQYGLACLVFRCLTGQVVYPRTEAAAVIYAHLAADPPLPSRHRADLPVAVDAAVTRATAKNPEHRFPSCAAFISALQAPSQPMRQPQPWPRQPASAPAGARHRSLPATLPFPEPAAPDARTHRVEPTPLPETAARAEVVPLPETVPVLETVPVIKIPAPSATTPLPRTPPQPVAVPVPVDVRAERAGNDRSITVTWTAGGQQEVEYKITRLTADDRWQVVGRTRSTYIVDGAVPPDSDIPAYGVVARLDSTTSDMARTPPSPPPATVRAPIAGPTADPEPDPDGTPAVAHLAVTGAGVLEFEWPWGVTEAMVVVREDRPPIAPDDPAAIAWKITNMRYQLDGGLVLPATVTRPCHVAVASCRREGSSLVVAVAFDPSARVTVDA